SARCSTSMRRAAMVFPVPGSPTVRNSVGPVISTPVRVSAGSRRPLHGVLAQSVLGDRSAPAQRNILMTTEPKGTPESVLNHLTEALGGATPVLTSTVE